MEEKAQRARRGVMMLTQPADLRQRLSTRRDHRPGKPARCRPLFGELVSQTSIQPIRSLLELSWRLVPIGPTSPNLSYGRRRILKTFSKSKDTQPPVAKASSIRSILDTTLAYPRR